MEKPSEADSRRLRSLFPSLSVSKRANSKAFNPLDDCVVAKEKRQKKGVRLKPRKITVVLITDKASTKVPRGLKRKDLLQRGYIKQIEFLRNMSAQEVRNKIIGGFPDKIGKKSKIAMLMADPKFHVLTKVDEREGGADAADVFELAGQGSLYVRITVSFTRKYLKWYDVNQCEQLMYIILSRMRIMRMIVLLLLKMKHVK